MGGVTNAAGTYDAALTRRQGLMGESGARALVKNWKVFRIAAFACIGGVLYGYNQGMFSGILTMPAFGSRMSSLSPCAAVTTIALKEADHDRHGRLHHRPDQEGVAHVDSGTRRLAGDSVFWLRRRGVLAKVRRLDRDGRLHNRCDYSGDFHHGRLSDDPRRAFYYVCCPGKRVSGRLKLILHRGMGVGSLSTIVPLYNSECAPP